VAGRKRRQHSQYEDVQRQQQNRQRLQLFLRANLNEKTQTQYKRQNTITKHLPH
jgi:hypothetical protein